MSFTGLYRFKGDESTRECMKTNPCAGWEVDGEYRVVSSVRGESYVELSFTAESPNEWRAGNKHDISFNFPFQITNANKVLKWTETLLIARSSKNWSMKSLLFKKPLSAIAQSPKWSYIRATKEKVWRGCEMTEISENKVEVKGCRRDFK